MCYTISILEHANRLIFSQGDFMPARKIISEKMADFLNSIAHPNRILIIEELNAKEQNVNSLQTILGTSHSVVSQHLSILRAHKVVKQRKEGNQVFYQLEQQALAGWLLDGLAYIEGGLQSEQDLRLAVDEAKTIWRQEQKDSNKKGKKHVQ
jgi:DNA-binding transcriptional ArsR family regulator